MSVSLRKEIGGLFSGVAKEIGRQAFGSSSKSSKPQYGHGDQQYINDMKGKMRDAKDWHKEQYYMSKEYAKKHIR
jgi:hypothetical protein